MSFERLLDQVMDTDKHIRYETVCDMEGKEVQTRIRDSQMLIVTWGVDGGQADIIERIQNMSSGDHAIGKNPMRFVV